MNLSAIQHESTLSMRQPVARNCVRFSIFTAVGDIAEVKLHYFKRSEPKVVCEAFMKPYASDWSRTQWHAVVLFPEEAHYIKYWFELTDPMGNSICYSEYGFSDTPPTIGHFELLQVNLSDLLHSPSWAEGIIFYQIFPERFADSGSPKSHKLEDWQAEPTRENYFGGDLKGIEAHLPYLQNLGIDALYLNPIFKADFNHKYATIDYLQIDPDFGTLNDLASLVKEAHARGIRVLLDGVFNHCGIHFKPFEDLRRNGLRSVYAKWFHPKKKSIDIDASCYECVGDYPYMPRLNTSNPEVQAYLLKIMLYWIEETGIDGWRLDVADEWDSDCLRFLFRSVREKHPDVLLLGETWGDAGRLLNQADQMDCAMNYLFRDAMVDYFAHRSISEETFAKRLGHMLMKYTPEAMSHMYNLLGSHDTARFLTECEGNGNRLRLAVAFQALFPGCPAIYYGDEVGMTGENDPGCRGGMVWDQPDISLLEWQTQWNRFRKEHSAARNGSFRILMADSLNHLFCFERSNEKEAFIAVFNLDESEHTLDFSEYGESFSVLPCSVKIIQKGGPQYA